MCLGVGIGLVLTVVLPWMIDSGYEVYDALTEADYKWPDMSVYYSSWNVTSSRTWRPDQRSQARIDSTSTQAGGGGGMLRGTPPPTTDPKVLDMIKLSESFPSGPGVDRTITVVHVGHTGGQALLQMNSALSCQEKYSKDPSLIPSCMQQPNLRTANSTSPFAKQAKYYFHMGTKLSDDVQQSTTFLFTLRNPVDRILSIYADSHPLACTTYIPETENHRPWGCTTKEYWNMPETDQYNFYTNCFPNVAPEEFSQAVKSPWGNNGTVPIITSIDQQRSDCRWLAKQVVSGDNHLIALAPHMRYNYQYYWQQLAANAAVKKEVLAIRSEQEDQDLALLHRLMGGDPRMDLPTVSESNTAPFVTPQAYQKLCCVLQEEIQMYETILNQAANLPEYAKRETIEDLRQKCGSATTGWDAWRMQCKTELESDSFLLIPSVFGPP